MELAGASTRQHYLVQRWERRSALNRRTEIAGLDPLGRCTLWSRGGRARATIPTGASLLGEPTRLHRHVVCTRHAAKKITGKKRTSHSSDARTAEFSTLRCTAEALPLAVDGFGGGASALRPAVTDERGSRTSAVRQPRLGGPRDSCRLAKELDWRQCGPFSAVKRAHPTPELCGGPQPHRPRPGDVCACWECHGDPRIDHRACLDRDI